MIANTDVNKSMRNLLAQKHTILPAKNKKWTGAGYKLGPVDACLMRRTVNRRERPLEVSDPKAQISEHQ
jgi:hypothetical protein